MPILSSKDTPFFMVASTFGCWVVNFGVSLAALFISLYLYITHDDLEQGFIEPVELSNNLNQVFCHHAIYKD
jgi:hypothetical protein